MECSQLRIIEDDLTGDAVIALLLEHLNDMRRISPPESCHVLDVDGLRAPEITFWSAWDGSELGGCAALKEMNPTTGEIKSMRTVRTHRGRGIGARLLEHLLAEAERRSYATLYLETGSMAEFEPARNLYAKYGFERCGPFGSYVTDPNSVFMMKRLGES
jgi:putative acetyltransferase